MIQHFNDGNCLKLVHLQRALAARRQQPHYCTRGCKSGRTSKRAVKDPVSMLAVERKPKLPCVLINYTPTTMCVLNGEHRAESLPQETTPVPPPWAPMHTRTYHLRFNHHAARSSRNG